MFRTINEVKHWGKSIWNSALPTKISFFMWKLCWKKVHLDAEIQRIGVHLASKCNYSRQPDIESLDYLFFKSDISKVGWN